MDSVASDGCLYNGCVCRADSLNKSASLWKTNIAVQYAPVFSLATLKIWQELDSDLKSMTVHSSADSNFLQEVTNLPLSASELAVEVSARNWFKNVHNPLSQNVMSRTALDDTRNIQFYI